MHAKDVARAAGRAASGEFPGRGRPGRYSAGTGAARHGEIDIVASIGRSLVICEVKTRSGLRFGTAARGGHAGRRPGGSGGSPLRWITAHGLFFEEIRIDVVGVLRTASGRVQHRARSRGGLDGACPHLCDRPGRGPAATSSRSRPTSRTAWWPCSLVGLPDTALREARDRIRSAIVNSRQAWPQRRITVGLSPASLPKRGSGFDVAIAMAILSADGVGAQGAAGRHGLPRRARPGRQDPAGSGRPALSGRGCRGRVQPRGRAAGERRRGGPGAGHAGRCRRRSLGACSDWLHRGGRSRCQYRRRRSAGRGRGLRAAG